MKSKNKDKNYIPILDQPIGDLKKPMGQSVDFDKTISQLLTNSENKDLKESALNNSIPLTLD